MQTVIISSKNPVKRAATEKGFAAMFPDQAFSVDTLSVPSGVSDQPMSDAETLQGARNRMYAARDAAPTADYWVGIEGGCSFENGHLIVFAWVTVLSNDHYGESRTAIFRLPKEVADLVSSGIELGIADDMVFNRTNSKQGDGAIGILTHGAIDRTDYYVQAVTLALVPFVNPKLTWGPLQSNATVK